MNLNRKHDKLIVGLHFWKNVDIWFLFHLNFENVLFREILIFVLKYIILREKK